LEKQLARERVIPGTDKYKRYGILGAWRGADGVDWERAAQLFGIGPAPSDDA
jgi:hypothetical protein